MNTNTRETAELPAYGTAEFQARFVWWTRSYDQAKRYYDAR